MDERHYLVDVRPILEDLGAVIPLESDVDLPEIILGTEAFKPLRPGHLVADVTNSGAGIVVSGSIDAEFEAVCSRCLREFPLRVTAAVEGFYVPPGGDVDIPEEQEVSYIAEEASIDLMEQILSALVLELPFAPLHAVDCPGICPRCGADLKEGECDCEPVRADSPFAALKDLLSPDESK
ncbi:MAG: YceD family protein [Coriobacteriia bacterium]